MGRSSGTMITVKVPVNWDAMTTRQRERLDKMTRRDTRVIKAYLGVIERHEEELLYGKRKKRLDAGALDELTLRTDTRNTVAHDFKERFPNISTNELQECRETAIGMWKVYLALGRGKPLHAKGYDSRKLPRHIFKRLFDFVYTPEKTIKHWLILRDSLDSVREGRTRHDRLAVPLSPSSYHLNLLGEGERKSVQVVKDRHRKWWVLFKVKLEPESIEMESRPPAVLAIDLGIKKAVCSVLLTQRGLKHVRYWKQEDKARQMERYDSMIGSLQSKKERLLAAGKNPDGVLTRLKELGSKRMNLSLDYDGKLTRELCEHIVRLAESYDLYVGIGRLKGIRNRARRRSSRWRGFRRMIHRWSFARITESLKHKLSMAGFDPKRVVAVPESWTSIMCSRCGHKGLRPKQSYFLCHTCGYRANADMNAAVNIGRRLITLIPSLRDENGLGQWLLTEAATPKTRRSIRSQGRSDSPERLPTSPAGGTVADCYDQTSLEEYASSTDPAMEKTMGNPSAAVSSGRHSSEVQRAEAEFRARDHVPATSDKRRDHPAGAVLLVAGDSSHDEG